jgi:hypothetical protein
VPLLGRETDRGVSLTKGRLAKGRLAGSDCNGVADGFAFATTDLDDAARARGKGDCAAPDSTALATAGATGGEARETRFAVGAGGAMFGSAGLGRAFDGSIEASVPS